MGSDLNPPCDGRAGGDLSKPPGPSLFCKSGSPVLDTLYAAGDHVLTNLSVGAPMDVVVWLRSLGLGKYEAAFRENDIDETVLPNLTAEDLKDLGVSIVGHRRKILDGIASLHTDAGAKAPSAEATAFKTTSASHEDRAERRQVTVMFSDLVDGALSPYRR